MNLVGIKKGTPTEDGYEGMENEWEEDACYERHKGCIKRQKTVRKIPE